MDAIYDFFYDNGYMPHGYCLLWQEELVFAHVFSDATIALAYFSLPVFLVVLLRKRDDLKFNWLIGMFALFILLCGVTHLFNIWTLFIPDYATQGVLKLFTAMASIATAIAAWPLLPKLLAIPNPSQLQSANDNLSQEIETRKEIADLLMQRTKTLQDTQTELKRSNDDLDSFAYIASHDLKAPLRGISNLAEWIEEDLDKVMTDESRADMTLLRERASRMTQMLDDLLSYARIGKTSEKIRTIQPQEFLRKTFDLVNADGRLSLTIEGDIPSFETAVSPFRLVVGNLMSNAIKHHDKDNGKLCISGKTEGNFLVFSVSDDGPGIAPEYHEKIFKMFETLAPRDDVEGSGVGLAAVKKTIDHFGGELSLETGTAGNDRGLTVRFTWPMTIHNEEAA